jgi:hypothetical protein
MLHWSFLPIVCQIVKAVLSLMCKYHYIKVATFEHTSKKFGFNIHLLNISFSQDHMIFVEIVSCLRTVNAITVQCCVILIPINRILHALYLNSTESYKRISNPTRCRVLNKRRQRHENGGWCFHLPGFVLSDFNSAGKPLTVLVFT